MRRGAWAVAAAGLCTAVNAGAAPLLQAAVMPAEAAVPERGEVEGGAIIRLRAARGERAPAVVVVRSEEAGLLTARATALYDEAGTPLAASAVEISRRVARGTRDDVLEPALHPSALTAGQNAVLWVEVAVPRGAEAGAYHGSLELRTGRATRSLPMEIEVLPLALPRKPSLATSFRVAAAGPEADLARAALRERVTVRLSGPPAFRVTPLEGTLQLDFRELDAALGALLEAGPVLPSSVAVSVPEAVPAPRRLEYLLAVRRHLAERGCAELLVNFSDEGSLLRRVQGDDSPPAVMLVEAREPAPRQAPFWWRLGSRRATTVGALDTDAPLPLGSSVADLDPGASPSHLRALGWAAFRAGAAGLYAEEPLELFAMGTDGEPLPTLRLKLLRAGLQDYEYLSAAARRDPSATRHVVEIVLAREDRNLPVDFDAARDELVRIIEQGRSRGR